MQGINCVPRIRQILRGIHGLKDVPLQQEVWIQAGILQPVHGSHELPTPICCQAVACYLSEGSLALNEAPRFMALEGVVPSLEGHLLDADTVSS